MISDITLGQFFPGDSALHRLDPRTKILLTIVFIVSVFLVNTPLGFLILLASVISLILASRISMKVILKGIKPIIFVLIFTVLPQFLPLIGFYPPIFSMNFSMRAAHADGRKRWGDIF